MKYILRSSILAFAFCLLAPCGSAFALTSADLAGIYQGTSTAVLPSGQIVTAAIKLTFKAKGKLTTVATVNGQTSKSKGTFQFASDDLILGNFPSGEFTAFVDVNGATLTFTLLSRSQSDGSVVVERTTATLIEKL